MKKTLLVIMSIFVLIAGLIVSCSSSGVDDITVLDSITSSPTSLFCWAGEKLDTSSVTVTASYSDGSSKKVTGFTVTPDTFTTTGTNTAIVSYTEKGVTKTSSITVDVQNKRSYTIKGGLNNDTGKIEWFDGFGIPYIYPDYPTITEIEFVQQNPKTFETGKVQGTDYTTKCNLTSDSNYSDPDGNVMGYSDGTKVWIVGEYIIGNPYGLGMFNDFQSLVSIKNINLLDTSEVTNMGSMFAGCLVLTSLDLSNWNTSNSTDMSYMFLNCKALTSLDLSSFDTSSVVNMDSMFNACEDLTSLNLSSFDTSNVTNMIAMFLGCTNLTSPTDFSHFKTSNVTSMNEMFCCCKALSTLDLSGWDTSSVTDMGGMFDTCSNLSTLNLSNWTMNTPGITSKNNMFNSCGTNSSTITINQDYESFFNDVLSGWTHTSGTNTYTKSPA